MFWVFGHKACGIWSPWPGIKPTPPALEGKILTAVLPGKSLVSQLFWVQRLSQPHKLRGLPPLFLWKSSPGDNTKNRDFPGAFSGKEPAWNAKDTGPRHSPRMGKIPWRRKWQPTPVFLPEKSRRQRSLVGYIPRGHKELDSIYHWLKNRDNNTKNRRPWGKDWPLQLFQSCFVCWVI